MSNGEIFSLIAIGISFIGFITSFIFSYKKAIKERDTEREHNINNVAEIKNNISTIKTNLDDIKYKVERIDEKMQNDHEKLIEHEQKIKNLEKAVFNNKGGGK